MNILMKLQKLTKDNNYSFSIKKMDHSTNKLNRNLGLAFFDGIASLYPVSMCERECGRQGL